VDNGPGRAMNDTAADRLRAFLPPLIRATMRRPTPSFTVEPESRRKSAQGFAPDEDQLIDEPAPEEVPSRDVNEDARRAAASTRLRQR
jgi:hypothetical protein